MVGLDLFFPLRRHPAAAAVSPFPAPSSAAYTSDQKSGMVGLDLLFPLDPHPATATASPLPAPPSAADASDSDPVQLHGVTEIPPPGPL